MQGKLFQKCAHLCQKQNKIIKIKNILFKICLTKKPEYLICEGDILLERTQGFQWNQDTFSSSSNDDYDKKESIGRYTDQQSTRLEYHVLPQVRMTNIFYFPNFRIFFFILFNILSTLISNIVFRLDLTFYK